MRRRFALLAIVAVAGCSSRTAITSSTPRTPIQTPSQPDQQTVAEWSAAHQQGIQLLLSDFQSISSDAGASDVEKMGDDCLVLLAHVTEFQRGDEIPDQAAQAHWAAGLSYTKAAAVHCINAGRTAAVEGVTAPSIIDDFKAMMTNLESGAAEINAVTGS